MMGLEFDLAGDYIVAACVVVACAAALRVAYAMAKWGR